MYNKGKNDGRDHTDYGCWNDRSERSVSNERTKQFNGSIKTGPRRINNTRSLNVDVSVYSTDAHSANVIKILAMQSVGLLRTAKLRAPRVECQGMGMTLRTCICGQGSHTLTAQ